MKLRRYLVFALLLVAFAGAIWWLDFQLIVAESRADLQLVTMKSTPPDSSNRQSATGRPVTILFSGDDDFAAGLRKQIAAQHRADPGVDGATVVGTPPQVVGGPVLRVAISDDGTTWTPIYSGGRLAVTMAYASDGDLSWTGKSPVVMPGGHPVTRVEGRVNVDDSTRGLVSRRAYRRHLGEQAGAELNKALEQSLADQVQPAVP